jgi:CHAD domain-containing protein
VKKKLWKSNLDVSTNLRRTLPKLARAFFKQGNHALAKQRDWNEIHDFRIAIKRFRYTLELFEPHYGPGLATRIDELRQIQTLLGNANDLIVTAGLLEAVSGTELLRTEFKQKAEAKLKRARSWWRSNMANPDVEQRWVSYFQRPAGRPPAVARPALAKDAPLKVVR